MPRPQGPHSHLGKRLQIIDLLSLLILPGAIVTCWPGLPRQGQAILFGALFVLTLAAVWWGSTLANTHNVKNAGLRILIHFYSLLGFLSLLAVFPAFLVVLAEVFLRTFNGAEWLASTAILLASGALTGSMLVLEHRRIRAAEANAAVVVAGAPDNPTPSSSIPEEPARPQS